MAEKSYKLEVITPDRVVLSERDIVSVVAPGAMGYLGVLAYHAPLMTALQVGALDFRRADGSKGEMALSGGFMEVFENTVTVLAETAEMGGEIDIDRAERAVERAKERLSARPPDVDIDRAQAALKRALNRVNVGRQARS